MITQAVDILIKNDLGHYTVPTHGLYPFQWNWDSCLTALGQAYFDEERAWVEIDTLFAHQWSCGMVPHIIFHKEDPGYFPGPDIWGTGRDVPTSGITQPPVAGFVVKRLFDRVDNKDLALRFARALMPKIHAWHQWFFRARDPEGTGLVALIHPWESGRDNSVDWDIPFDRVPTENVPPFQRRDTQHADPAHRPTHEQYLRYLWLVHHFKDLNWQTEALHDASPFQVVDPGFNAILMRSCSDLAALAEDLGAPQIAAEAKAQAVMIGEALESLWSEKWGQYLCLDRITGQLIDSPSIGGIIPAFAPIRPERSQALAKRIANLGERTEYLICSHDPDTPDFDGSRYWRGPAWLIINYMVADGLGRAGEHAIVGRIVDDSLRLIKASGFAEYYDPNTGAPCGGGTFSWTAAMVIEFLTQSNNRRPDT